MALGISLSDVSCTRSSDLFLPAGLYCAMPLSPPPPDSRPSNVLCDSKSVARRRPSSPCCFSSSLILFAAGGSLLDRLGVGSSFRTHRIVAVLSCSPVKRDLVPRRKDRALPVTYSHRTIAVLVQATGLERRPCCDRCTRANGPWTQCVVAHTAEGIQSTRGSCANCLWNNQGSLCSLRTSTPNPAMSLRASF